MSTAVELFDKNREMFSQMIPAGLGLTVDRFKQVMIYCMRVSPGLADCEPGSMVAAVAQVAQLGLDLTPAAGQAYLVPYKSRCQLQIGYKGFIALAVRSGGVKSVTAFPVYSGDEFAFEYGSDERLRHVPALKDRGDLVAAWAVAVLADGSKVFRVIGADDIAKAESFGQAKRTDSPWRVHRDEMARKTAIRRLIRDLVLSSVVGRAVAADDMVVKGMTEDGEVIDGEWIAESAADESKPRQAAKMKDHFARPAQDDATALRETVDAIAAWLREHHATEQDLRAYIEDTQGQMPPPVARWSLETARAVLAKLNNGWGAALAAGLAPPPSDDAGPAIEDDDRLPA